MLDSPEIKDSFESVERDLKRIGKESLVGVLREILDGLKKIDLPDVLYPSLLSKWVSFESVLEFMSVAETDRIWLFRTRYVVLFIDTYDNSEDTYVLRGEELRTAVEEKQVRHPDTGAIIGPLVGGPVFVAFEPTKRFRALHETARQAG